MKQRQRALLARRRRLKAAERTAPAVPGSDGHGVSALHRAVARAIAETRTEQPTDELVADCERAAAAAIGVVLAEAQQSIEALCGHDSLGGEVESIEDDAPPGSGWLLERSDVVEALAALNRI